MAEKGILEKPIAVLGGGSCGQTFAADLTLEGYSVRLYDLPAFAPKTLGSVLKTGEIELTGPQINFKWFKRTGTPKVVKVTTDMREALDGAGVVIVALPAKGHRPFFKEMIPHLQDGQMISIFPDNFGSLMLRAMMRASGCEAKVIIGGWSSMPYGVRMSEPGKLNLILRTRELMGDALPASDGEEFFSTMKQLPVFDGTVELKRGDTVIGVSLSNPNPVVHVPGSILNVGAMEVTAMDGALGIPKGKYSMYKHGMCPAVSRVQFAFYKEEKKIAEALGIQTVDFTEDQFFSKGSIMGVEYGAPYSDVILPPIVGPDSVEHRYFTEDIPVGTVVRYRLAKQLGVDAPVIESMVRLGSLACNHDFLAEGVSLKELGLDGLSREEVVKLIRG